MADKLSFWTSGRLFYRLIGGFTLIVLVVSVVQSGIVVYFLRAQNKANEVRFAANRVDRYMLEVRRREKDFFLRDLANPEFYEKGETEYLKKHAGALQALRDQENLLMELVGKGELGDKVSELRRAVQTYEESFSALVQGYRERGFKDWGLEGKWREVIHKLEAMITAVGQVQLERDLLLLRRHEKDYLLRREEEYAEQVFDQLQVVRGSLGQLGATQAAAAAAAVSSYEQAFKDYLALEEKIGKTEDQGLQGAMRRAIHKVDPLVEEILKAAIENSQQAVRTLVVSLEVLVVLGLLFAFLLSLLLSRAIAVPIEKLTTAVTALASEGGDLTQRVEVKSKDEIGRLGEAFNQMVGDLRGSREKLIAARAYSDNIITSLIDTLIVVDPDAKIKTVNQATCDLLGYQEAELIGKAVSVIFAEEEEEEEVPFKGTKLEELLKAGSIRDYALTYKTKSGERIPVSFSGSVMYEPDSGQRSADRNTLNAERSTLNARRILGIVGIARDMREMKRLMQKEKDLAAAAAAAAAAADAEKKRTAELEQTQAASLNIMEDLERRRKEVEERERQLRETQGMLVQAGKLTALGQLGAGIAHELNQPIGAIMGFSQFLLSQVPPESPLVGNLKLIEQQSQRMAKIVDNIRTFAREGTGEQEPINLNQSIDDALMLVSAQLKARQITLELKKDERLPSVVADKNEMQQLFINLITNARDAIEDTGNGGTITITTQAGANGWVKAVVRDTGVGIREETRDRIFDPFFTTKAPGKGTGLGLSIVHGIIERHHGAIEVDSTFGQGATFIVRLPVAPEQNKRDARASV